MRHTQKGPILRVTTSDFAYDHLDDLIFLLHVLVGADGTRPSLSTYHRVRAAYRPFLTRNWFASRMYLAYRSLPKVDHILCPSEATTSVIALSRNQLTARGPHRPDYT